MIDGTANIKTATDHNAWRGLIEAAKSISAQKVKIKKIFDRVEAIFI